MDPPDNKEELAAQCVAALRTARDLMHQLSGRGTRMHQALIDVHAAERQLRQVCEEELGFRVK
jgi:hypothetical protein